jgi:hypothetical protein
VICSKDAKHKQVSHKDSCSRPLVLMICSDKDRWRQCNGSHHVYNMHRTFNSTRAQTFAWGHRGKARELKNCKLDSSPNSPNLLPVYALTSSIVPLRVSYSQPLIVAPCLM